MMTTIFPLRAAGFAPAIRDSLPNRQKTPCLPIDKNRQGVARLNDDLARPQPAGGWPRSCSPWRSGLTQKSSNKNQNMADRVAVGPSLWGDLRGGGSARCFASSDFNLSTFW